MILLHNSMELHENKARIPSSVYGFLVRQFAFLEDEDPQMNVYGDMDFRCTTGTIGIIYSEDELDGLKILDEAMLSDDVKVLTCLDEALPLDVVLSPSVEHEEFAFLADYRKLSAEEKRSIRLIIKNYLKKYE